MNDSVVLSLRDQTTGAVHDLFPGNYSAQGTWYDGLIFKVRKYPFTNQFLQHQQSLSRENNVLRSPLSSIAGDPG